MSVSHWALRGLVNGPLILCPWPWSPHRAGQWWNGPASDKRQPRLPSPPALGSHTESCRIKAGQGAFVPSCRVLCPLVLVVVSTFYFTQGSKGTDQRPPTPRMGILSAEACWAARGSKGPQQAKVTAVNWRELQGAGGNGEK